MSEMKKVRFALIGCGMIARMHATAISQIEEAELYGVFDPYAPSAEKFAREYQVKAYPSLEEMLSDPAIDAVSICTPSGLHTRQAVAAMEAGKAIVCEKPMSLTLKDADLLIDTARRTGAKTCIISQFRFSDATREVRRALDEGAFGKIVSGSLQMKYYRSKEYYASGAWRGTWEMDGGGCLMNQGIHGIDVFRYLMGPLKSLTAITKTQTRPVEVEDSAVAIVEFANGAVGTIEGSTTCYPGYPRRIEICGEQGSVVMEEDTILRWDLPIPCRLPVGDGAKNVASSDPAAIACTGHVRQIQNLVNAILHDEPLMADAASGRPPLEVILGIYESGKTNQPVYF